MPTLTDATLLVKEMYASIQGESTWAGLPCFFIRLSGCPLRCRWCDTEYAFTGGDRMPLGSILQAAKKAAIPLVEITGGEPLAQPNCPALCQQLLDEGFTVLIETAGSHPIETLPSGVIRIMDLKCPDSGEMDRNLWSNLDHLNREDEVKFVIASRRDYEWARDRAAEHGLDQKVKSVLFSPVWGDIEPVRLVEWILEDRIPVRFQLQMHKVVWDPATKSV